MKQIIRDVLDDMSNSQVNLSSEAARETVSSLISAALKTNGFYKEYTEYELDEQKARAAWVCSICGENTFEVDYDYIGSGYNHLGCELKSQKEIDEYVEDIDEQAYAQGRKSSKDVRREKNWLQKKHEDKVFGHDIPTTDDDGRDLNFLHGSEEVDGMYFDDEVEGWEKAVEDMPEGLKRAKELSQEALEEGLKRQLSEEIVDNKDKKYIYESPDGGKTIYRRKFGETERELYKEKTDEG